MSDSSTGRTLYAEDTLQSSIQVCSRSANRRRATFGALHCGVTSSNFQLQVRVPQRTEIMNDTLWEPKESLRLSICSLVTALSCRSGSTTPLSGIVTEGAMRAVF